MKGATWKQVHGELIRLARAKGAYDGEEARWLLEGKRVRVHEALGYGTYLSYLEHVFGYRPRLASEKLRVAEAISQLPAMAAALAGGELCWSAVRELTRVATPETEAAWIADARGKSMREVEDKVAGRRPGDWPDDPCDPAAKRHVLRLEISGDALAAFREARKRIELDVGHSLDDDEAVRMLAHYALGGPTDAGRAAYQVAVTVCKQCGRGTRDGAGRVLAVEDHELDAALCDAQHIGDTHVDGEPAAAKQDIPPRIPRLVYRRAHGRCEVPGCAASRYLEIHHIVPRSAGGTHDPGNLLLTCSAHHTQVHRGALRVRGTAPDGLRFERRYPTCPMPPSGPSQSAPPPPAHTTSSDVSSDLSADVFAALTGLGFSAAQARQAIAASSRDVDFDTLLREALAHLRPPVRVWRASEPTARYGTHARRAEVAGRRHGRLAHPATREPLPRSASVRRRPAAARLTRGGPLDRSSDPPPQAQPGLTRARAAVCACGAPGDPRARSRPCGAPAI